MSIEALETPVAPSIEVALQHRAEVLSDENERLNESLKQVVAMFAREDRGWSDVFGSDKRDEGLTLDDLKKWSGEIRNSQVGNPHIKRGLSLRQSYVWQNGIKYRGIPVAKQGQAKNKNVQAFIDLPLNQRYFFGAQARNRRENALYSDCLHLVVGDDSTKKLRVITLDEIDADYRNPDDKSEVWAYRRTWTSYADAATPTEKKEWYFVDTFVDKRTASITPSSSGEPERVSQTETAFDLIANSVDGFAYGSPDALAALVWSRVSRDATMAGVTMTQALAQFAFKASVATKSGGESAVMKLGGGGTAGSTAVIGATNDLTPMSSAGKAYDFAGLRDLVSIVATSLDLTVEDLSGTAEAGANKASSLPLPTRLAIERRRDEHIAFDKRILAWMGAPDAEVFFSALIDPTDLYRAQEGVAIKMGTGLYEGKEIKTMFEALEGNDVTDISIPEGFMLPNNLNTLEAEAKIAAKNTPKPTSADPTNGGDLAPTQGSPSAFGGTGPNANDINGDRASGK